MRNIMLLVCATRGSHTTTQATSCRHDYKKLVVVFATMRRGLAAIARRHLYQLSDILVATSGVEYAL